MAVLAALDLPEQLWSLAADRVLKGMMRTMAPLRQKRARVEQIYGDVIRDMISWLLLKYPKNTEELDSISLKFFRTLVLVILQYFLLARVSDARKLQACDIKVVKLVGHTALEVTFNFMKNDQVGLGASG